MVNHQPIKGRIQILTDNQSKEMKADPTCVNSIEATHYVTQKCVWPQTGQSVVVLGGVRYRYIVSQRC